MKRAGWMAGVGLAAVVASLGVRADVKTQEKATFKLEGLLGAFVNRAAGGAAGRTTSIALKGDRLASPTTTRATSST